MFQIKKKTCLHLHPPSALWPLLNTWLFGVSSSLTLFGLLPCPVDNNMLSLKELLSEKGFDLTMDDTWDGFILVSRSLLTLDTQDSCHRSCYKNNAEDL